MEACLTRETANLDVELAGCIAEQAAAMDDPEDTGGMALGLRGVPRPVLQTVFGKVLGRRIWEGAGRSLVEGKGPTGVVRERNDSGRPGAEIADAEIVGGMIDFVGQRAAEALRENGRLAKAIGLRLVFADGATTLERKRLTRPTDDGVALTEAARDLFDRVAEPGAAVASVDLRVTSIVAEQCVPHEPSLAGAVLSSRLA